MKGGSPGFSSSHSGFGQPEAGRKKKPAAIPEGGAFAGLDSKGCSYNDVRLQHLVSVAQ